MTPDQLQAEQARCRKEIEACEHGSDIGSVIGFLDWHAELIELDKEAA